MSGRSGAPGDTWTSKCSEVRTVSFGSSSPQLAAETTASPQEIETMFKLFALKPMMAPRSDALNAADVAVEFSHQPVRPARFGGRQGLGNTAQITVTPTSLGTTK